MLCFCFLFCSFLVEVVFWGFSFRFFCCFFVFCFFVFFVVVFVVVVVVVLISFR